MSLILDALKKLEQETSAREKRADKVSVQILRSDHVAPKFNRMLLLAVFSAITGALFAMALVNAFSGLIKPSSPVLPASNPASPPVSYSISAATQPLHMATVQSQSSEKQSNNIPKSSEYPASPEQSKKHRFEQKITPLPKTGTKTDNKIFTVSEKSLVNPTPSFTISGIIWYEDRGDRRAVVNDMVVGEDAVVNGAKVMEIKPDRVRFSREKQKFDVILGKNLTEITKGK